MVGEPTACARDALAVSIFAVLVGTSVVVEELEELVDFLISINFFMCHCQFRKPIANLMLKVVNLSKDLENIIQVSSSRAIPCPGLAVFDRRQQFVPFID